MPLRIRALTVVGSRIAKQIAGEIAMKELVKHKMVVYGSAGRAKEGFFDESR